MGITSRDVHIDRPLSNLVVGFEPQGTIVQNFLPIVNVGKQSDLYFKYDKGDFFRVPSTTVRAPRTKGRTATVDYLHSKFKDNKKQQHLMFHQTVTMQQTMH